MPAWLLPLVIGGGMTGLGALGQRNAQRAALARQREHELEALRRERLAADIRDQAARDAHAERSEGRQALLEALPDFSADAEQQQVRIADLLGQAAEAGREIDAAESAPMPEAADAYEKAQTVMRAKVGARQRQMEALRRATETPADAALGTGRRLRSLGDVLGAAGGDARLAADLGASAAMPWETGARLHRGWGAQVRPDPSLLTSIFSGVGPSVMGYGIAGGLGSAFGGGTPLPAGQPPAPVSTLRVFPRDRLHFPSGAFG